MLSVAKGASYMCCRPEDTYSAVLLAVVSQQNLSVDGTTSHWWSPGAHMHAFDGSPVVNVPLNRMLPCRRWLLNSSGSTLAQCLWKFPALTGAFWSITQAQILVHGWDGEMHHGPPHPPVYIMHAESVIWTTCGSDNVCSSGLTTTCGRTFVFSVVDIN
jgi:hypothetical protein